MGRELLFRRQRGRILAGLRRVRAKSPHYFEDVTELGTAKTPDGLPTQARRLLPHAVLPLRFPKALCSLRLCMLRESNFPARQGPLQDLLMTMTAGRLMNLLPTPRLIPDTWQDKSPCCLPAPNFRLPKLPLFRHFLPRSLRHEKPEYQTMSQGSYR